MITFLHWLLRLFYRFRAYDTAALRLPGPVLLLPNHVSWWDWLLIGVCLDDDWRFVTSSTAAKLSWIHKRIMVNRRTFPVDMNSPFAVKRMAEYLQKGGRLVLFPEGRITSTGSLMKLFDGTGFLIFKTQAKVVTAYIRGAERLPFARSPGRTWWFPRLSVHFSAVQSPPTLGKLSATQARVVLTEWVRDRMVQQRCETELVFNPETIPAAIVNTARRRAGQVILQDASLQELTYRRLLAGANLLANQWRSLLDSSATRVGLLLPNVNSLPITTLSIWTAGKVPAILNFSAGIASMLACAQLAGLKQIITSRTFLDRANLDLTPLEQAGIQLLFLEDIRPRITGWDRLLAMLSQLRKPNLSAFTSPVSGSDPAVVLFTSGSEGDPKAVELTHRNLRSNIYQMLSVIDITDADRAFNALPLFHSFGLTVGLLLPLVRGIYVLLYPSPLHYRVVPAAFYNLNCTIMFGTNTFLNGYARKGHAYDFRSLRYLVSGGEKVQESTAALWMRKFGVRILEGYGATECSPCLSVNLPMRPRQGSVGQFLPGVEWRLEPVDGVTDGGRLFVRGPNIMRGYLNSDSNARFQALGGWYDTGDIVKVDADGYVFILGRLKRFAKVSGEMVSLTAVEDALAGAFPDYGLRFNIAVVAKPDAARGEKLIAVTNEPRLTLEAVRDALQARGLSNLAVPRAIKCLHDLPKLGTGKIDHRELEKLV